MQQKTYQDALAGNRAAQRKVLRMIAKREPWLAAKARQRPLLQVVIEPEDPTNAHEALLLLGIAEPDTRWYGEDDAEERLRLQPRAVQAGCAGGAAERCRKRTDRYRETARMRLEP